MNVYKIIIHQDIYGDITGLELWQNEEEKCHCGYPSYIQSEMKMEGYWIGPAMVIYNTLAGITTAIV